MQWAMLGIDPVTGNTLPGAAGDGRNVAVEPVQDVDASLVASQVNLPSVFLYKSTFFLLSLLS